MIQVDEKETIRRLYIIKRHSMRQVAQERHHSRKTVKKELRAQYIDDPEALLILDKEQHEIDISRKYHKWYGLAYFIVQKR